MKPRLMCRSYDAFRRATYHTRKPGKASLASALLLALALAPDASGAEGWERISFEDGIEVSRLEVAGRELPLLQARGTIDADLFEVLAVIADAEHHPEWMYRCTESRILEREGQTTAIVYQRTDLPWPVGDRDAVVRGETELRADGAEAWTRFRAVESPAAPVREGIVRMPRLEGHYRLRALGPERTEVEYRIDVDPGGSLPPFMRREAVKSLAGETLRGLRRQVASTRGQHDEFRRRWDPRLQSRP